MDLGQQRRIQAFQQRFREFKEHEQLNTTAVESKWHEILADEKLQQQKASLDCVRAKYRRQLDRCDAVIARLLHWVDDCESQYQFAQRGYQHNLGLLQNLALSRLAFEGNRFDRCAQTTADEFESTRAQTLAEYFRHEAEVRDIVNAIEHEYEAKNAMLLRTFRAEEDSLQSKHQELASTLKTHLVSETNAVIDASKRAFEAFKQATEGKMQQFNVMYEKHKQRQKEMKQNQEAILRNAAEIAHWRRKIKSNERESRESNDRLRQEKENLSLHFRELKETMARFRRLEEAKLAEISVAFEDIHNNLSEKLKLAEKILKYAEMTRELETEREQVIPFPPSLVDTDPEIQRQMRQFKLQLKGDNKFVEESDLFDKFYRRYNKALLETLALARERGTLVQHNQRLKAMLRKYMTGTGVSKDLMEHPNTLFIVNQETNAPLRRVDHDHIPVVDAKLTVDAIKLQGY
jgi:hypothetical protein